MIEDRKRGTVNWLAVVLGKADSLKPPDLTSERIKNLLGRAMLTPTELAPDEIQEIAAAVLAHLVAQKKP